MADRYGLAALVPNERRAPQMPDATPTHVLEALLTLAVTQPTVGGHHRSDDGTAERGGATTSPSGSAWPRVVQASSSVWIPSTSA
ncbi:MAG: hypothetical protein ABSE98_12295, partial [Acidimicrobiales bacterium]